MNHVERQPEKYLDNKISYLRTTVDDIRSDQSFGTNAVRMYRIFNISSNIDITLTTVTSSTPQCVEVTLTPNTVASNPVIAFDYAVQFSSSIGTANLYFRIDSLPPVSGVQKFRFYVIANGTRFPDLSLGFTFWTISPATYSCAAVTP